MIGKNWSHVTQYHASQSLYQRGHEALLTAVVDKCFICTTREYWTL